ncbi:hypothetical protein MKK55_00790 [Methylobacterium sp. J-059]|jgi:hypothetical protein|uniref:hypothetical protein n=1 Tax=Methylobacterium sp. J-059 TaxID=2836643 RepID=UPI001FB8A1DE|nr:hypothetical protein [Methylobacterium sp. J-059]MCJ2037502.1 hypothetical protein [Methylobacterium sp. J-059]
MDFEHLLGLHTGTRRDPLPIVSIDPLVARALGADVRQVLLSAATIRKQLVHHRELPISVYRALPPCLLRGAYRQDGPRSAVVLFTEPVEPGRHFRAYVKATQAGHELYLTSFLTMRDRDMRRELRKPYPLIRAAL